MNEDACLYAQTCDFQKRDSSRILDTYFELLKWQDGDKIMDVGAGEGSVSLEVLLPKLPKNFKKLVLSDISVKLLEFASKRCDHERVYFRQMDISSRNFSEEFQQHFDHIFSFYCLNWVVGREKNLQAMKNIYDMLKPGGDIVFTIISSTPIYDFWENMAKTKKWAPYSKNVASLISPYHHLNNPVETLRAYLEDAGFMIHVCKAENCSYIFSDFSKFLKMALSVNPFFQSLPKDKCAEFIQDYGKEIKKHPKITIFHDGKEKLRLSYDILIACASK